ncbi:MAG: ABC transporter substrate-binding protein [Treponema sp.]|nr:ABC transporter substrate-binding protein [Treponema sp.]
MKKNLVIVASVLSAAVALAGCSKKSDGKLAIGVIQLVEHNALDANYQGFVDGLKEAGYVDGENITIDYQNAQGEQANCTTIADKFVSDKKDMIFAIATPAAQAIAAKTETIPVLISSVTDPKSAGLVDSNEKPGHNITGTSDLTPCAAQIDLIKQIVPGAKKVGMLFCSAEDNSRFQITLAEAECKKIGLDYEEFTVSNQNEVMTVVQSMVGKVDAIYAPTDNMIAATMGVVSEVATSAKIPVICGEDGMVQSGGLATYGLNYYELGKQTATMAVEIIKNGRKPGEMPIQYLATCDFSYNPETAEILGLDLSKF